MASKQPSTQELRHQLTEQRQLVAQYLELSGTGETVFTLPLANSLSILLQGDAALLPRFAGRVGRSIRIWGPAEFHEPGLVLRLTFFFASHERPEDALVEVVHYDLDCYLKTVIGTLDGLPFTPLQIINWVRSKDGGAHYDVDKPGALSAARGVEFHVGGMEFDLVHRALFQIGAAVVEILDALLEETGATSTPSNVAPASQDDS